MPGERGPPVDFVSWHRYGDDPAGYAVRAAGHRAALDACGFQATGLHLNEWNYLTGGNWPPKDQGPPRDRYFEAATGPAAVAFVASVLMTLQDTSVDAACYFPANTQPSGLFGPHGTPHKTFHAFRKFRELLAAPVRGRVAVATTGAAP